MDTNPALLWKRLDNAFRGYRAQTGLELNAAHLELHVNPEEWIEAKDTWARIYGLTATDKRIYGVPVVIDPSLEHGKPELRSTWKMTI